MMFTKFRRPEVRGEIVQFIHESQPGFDLAAIVCDGDLIAAKHLPPEPPVRPEAEVLESPDTVSFRIGTSLDEAEKQLILRTLTAHGNNKTRTAEILGISLKTLHNKLKAYGA